MNNNFKSIIWLSGYFGIVGREHVERLVYRNKYSNISANRTLAKLEREFGYLKRIDRGKRKPDAFKLTNLGIKQFRFFFGEEPKNYNSSDKLMHSIQILNFYVYMIEDMVNRNIIKGEYNIIEEKEKLVYSIQNSIHFMYKNKEKTIIPDSFFIYRFSENKILISFLEIENSDRKAAYVASKTINNYEGYYLSGRWKNEPWQIFKTKLFPPILVVCYSKYKVKEFIRHFKNKKNINLLYLFTDYKSLKEEGISGNIWYNIDGQKISLFI